MTARAKAAPAAAAGLSNFVGAVIKVALSQLRGIDRCNPRKVEDDVSSLAASLRAEGQQNPLTVRPARGGEFDVLVGSRRLRALREIAGEAAHRFDVKVQVFNGDDEAARDFALTENFERSPLHPLDEAEAFAGRVNARGFDNVAARWGLPRPALLKKLALTQLSERVRLIWLAGRIQLPAAEAFTAARDAAAQDALLDAPDAASILSSPAEIRKRLTEGHIPASAPVARFVIRYVGIGVHVAAGGVLIEDMFAAEPRFADAQLLRTQARDELSNMALALRRDEGWGFVLWDESWAGYDQVEPDYIPDETARLAAIESILDDPEIGEVEAALTERDQIERAAALRAVPQSERHRHGAHLSWDLDGRLAVERGLVRREPLADRATPPPRPPRFAEPPAPDLPSGSEDFSAVAAAAVSPSHPSSGAANRRPLHVPALDAPLAPAARRVAERAASLAIGEVVARDLCFALAATIASAIVAGRHRRPVRIEREHGPFAHVPDWTLPLPRMTFAEALRAALAREPAELLEGFAALVASSVDLRGADGDYASAFAAAAASRFPDLPERIAETFDYPGFFAAASRATALLAIRDCGGEAFERSHAWRDNSALAAEAARIARAKSWLPEFLRVRTADAPPPLSLPRPREEGPEAGPGPDAPLPAQHDEAVP